MKHNGRSPITGNHGGNGNDYNETGPGKNSAAQKGSSTTNTTAKAKFEPKNQLLNKSSTTNVLKEEKSPKPSNPGSDANLKDDVQRLAVGSKPAAAEKEAAGPKERKLSASKAH